MKTKLDLERHREILDRLRDHSNDRMHAQYENGSKRLAEYEALGHAIELIDAEIAGLPVEVKASAAA